MVKIQIFGSTCRLMHNIPHVLYATNHIIHVRSFISEKFWYNGDILHWPRLYTTECPVQDSEEAN
jgi:hypothetical protein